MQPIRHYQLQALFGCREFAEPKHHVLHFELQDSAKKKKEFKSTLGDFRNISTISIFLLAVAPYNFAILIPKWCKCSFLDSKINKGDFRLYFTIYEKKC